MQIEPIEWQRLKATKSNYFESYRNPGFWRHKTVDQIALKLSRIAADPACQDPKMLGMIVQSICAFLVRPEIRHMPHVENNPVERREYGLELQESKPDLYALYAGNKLRKSNLCGAIMMAHMYIKNGNNEVAPDVHEAKIALEKKLRVDRVYINDSRGYSEEDGNDFYFYDHMNYEDKFDIIQSAERYLMTFAKWCVNREREKVARNRGKSALLQEQFA